MQTFLPFTDMQASVKALDYRRLGKQRIEVVQMLKALLGLNKGWRNHPATLQWRGYESALCEYGLYACAEWISRGYVDNTAPVLLQLITPNANTLPPWWGGKLHDYHKGHLYRKDNIYYAQWRAYVLEPYSYFPQRA